MAISTISITQGTGTPVTVDTAGAAGSMQVIKLAESAAGSTNLVPSSVANGLTVDVTRVQGTVQVVQGTAGALKVDASGAVVPIADNGGSLTVDAPMATPVAVRISTGGAWVDTLPVTVGGTVTVAGTVAISGTPAVTQSGAWNIGTVTSITNAVTVAGTVSISGTPTVQGTVTSNQGAAGAVGAAWPVKVTDATNTAALQNVGGVYCLPVKVLAQAGGGYSQQDKTAFTEGTTPVEAIGGVYNDGFAGSPAAGQVSVLRITAQRAAHVSLRRNDGTEIGTSATPLVVVGAATGGNLAVQNAPSSTGVWKTAVTFGASQTDQAIHTPAAGKVAYIEGLIITPTAAGSTLKIYDQANAAANMIFQGQPGTATIIITPARPIPLSAANNILRYATGASAAGDITAWGYDA